MTKPKTDKPVTASKLDLRRQPSPKVAAVQAAFVKARKGKGLFGLAVPALAQAYREHECLGIAAFLDVLPELDDDERILMFRMMLTKMAGTRPSTVEDPLQFFTTLITVRERKSPFMDDGMKLLDLCCREVARIWQECAPLEE
jgi:hypothetical protein